MPTPTQPRAGTLYLVHVLTHATRSRLDGLLSGLGLTSFHYTVLSAIGRNEGLSSSRLSRRFYVTPQAMGEVITMLEKRRFIVRTEDRSNRKVLQLSLTDFAREALAAGDRIVEDFESTVFEGRSEEEMALLRLVISSALEGLRNP